LGKFKDNADLIKKAITYLQNSDHEKRMYNL
jgi:hypothetical protein